MKTTTYRTANFTKQANIPYPNASTRNQILDRAVELLLMAGLGIGAAAIFLFLLAIV